MIATSKCPYVSSQMGKLYITEPYEGWNSFSSFLLPIGYRDMFPLWWLGYGPIDAELFQRDYVPKETHIFPPISLLFIPDIKAENHITGENH